MGKVTANRGARNHQFYAGFAIAAVLVVFAGFARTYYLRAEFGFPAPPGFLELHGLVMTLAFVLFFVQVVLIYIRRPDLHRRLGVLGAGLAAATVMLTAMVVLGAAQRRFTAFPETVDWPAFLLLSLGTVLVYALLFCAAIWFRRVSDIHKRLMVLASLSIWGTAIGRIPLHFIEAGGLWRTIGISDLCVLVCVAVDNVRECTLHPAFLWGGLVIFTSHPLLIWIGGTPSWVQTAAWLVR